MHQGKGLIGVQQKLTPTNIQRCGTRKHKEVYNGIISKITSTGKEETVQKHSPSVTGQGH